jgi:hypothetical protein
MRRLSSDQRMKGQRHAAFHLFRYYEHKLQRSLPL